MNLFPFGSVFQSVEAMLEKECSPYNLALTYDIHSLRLSTEDRSCRDTQTHRQRDRSKLPYRRACRSLGE